MKKLFLLVVGMMLAVAGVAADDAELNARIRDNIYKAVVKVEGIYSNGNSFTGTGFLIATNVTRGTNSSRLAFLITNKHMIEDWKLGQKISSNRFDFLKIHYYSSNQVPSLVHLQSLKDEGLVIYHPDPNVDIVAIALLNQYSPPSGLRDSVILNSDFLIPFESTDDVNSPGMGGQVFALGYPKGITSLNNNYPIAKAGYIGSLPGEEFRIWVNNTELRGKLYLVDGLLVPGNSGGPVVMPAELKMRIEPKTQRPQFGNRITKNGIIGIMSMNITDSGLSIVYSADYIAETIALYVNRVDRIEGDLIYLR